MHKRITGCRGCGIQDWQLFLRLGSHFVVDFVKERDDNALRAPLDLIRCNSCNLVQLIDSVEPDRLYRKFWYRSGINESMKRALKDVAVCAYNAVGPLMAGEKVLDVGCNDGSLLLMYPRRLRTVGIDPASELVKEASARGVGLTINNYFSKKAVEFLGPFKIITAIAMFYDLEDPLQFLQDCRDVLAEDGVLVIQMNYLKAMIENCAVDNISHEHLTYFSVTTLEDLVIKAGLELQGVEENPVNGGSLRAYITHPGRTLYGFSLDKQVSLHAYKYKLRQDELLMGLNGSGIYQEFARRAERTFVTLKDYVMDRHLAGKKVYVYGASTRGSTLLQCLDLPEGTFIAAAERDENKYGLMTVGTWIPIKPEKECREDADVFFVLPWHFREQIVKREEAFIYDGGELVFPLPVPQVVTEDGEMDLMPVLRKEA